MDIYGYVYRVTSTIDGKTYIGRHRYLPGEDWNYYLGSGVFITHAVAKYGRENFKKELVSSHPDRVSLVKAEELAIIKEILEGRGQFNIHHNRARVKAAKNLTAPDTALIVKLYTEELKSLDSIAAAFGVARNKIRAVLEVQDIKLRDRKSTKQLQNRADQENKPKKQCVICFGEVTSKDSRTKTCSRKCRGKLGALNVSENESSGPRMSAETRAKISASALGNQRATGNRGSLMSAHIRWHLKRNLVNPECKFCKPS